MLLTGKNATLRRQDSITVVDLCLKRAFIASTVNRYDSIRAPVDVYERRNRNKIK